MPCAVCARSLRLGSGAAPPHPLTMAIGWCLLHDEFRRVADSMYARRGQIEKNHAQKPQKWRTIQGEITSFGPVVLDL